MEEKEKVKKSKIRKFFKILGPGLVTGAADDDPSGIATYAQTGAQFGYGQVWMMLFVLPLMTAVQEACARIGAVTGKGLANVVKENYDKKVLYFVVFSLLVANIINIGADIGAMAAALNLIVPLPFSVLALFFTVFILVLEIFTSYKTYSKILKWLAVFLLAYPLTAIIAGQNWLYVFKSLLVPNIELNFAFLFILTAVLGTTITPYMFFWEASQEVEEEILQKRLGVNGGIPRIGKRFIRNLRWDNALGMFLSNLTAFFIIITTASVLHSKGITNIETAADAAYALEPLVSTFPNSGFLAKSIFAFGVVGLGLLAIPVLAGSASYAFSETFNWKEGYSKKAREAHGFYGVIVVATFLGLLMNFIGIDPIKALIFTAVINGIVAIPLIFLIAKIASREDIMGDYKLKTAMKLLVWTTFTAMFLAAIAMGFSIIVG